MKLLCSLIPVLMLAAPLLSAKKMDRSFYYDFGEKFYYEIINLAADSPDSTRFIIAFRLRNDLLSFTRVNSAALRQDVYMAAPVMYLEFADSLGVIRHSTEWRDTVYAGRYENTLSKKEFVYGTAGCTLKAGKYTVSFEIGDFKTPREYRFKEKDVAGISYLGTSKLSKIFFAEPGKAGQPERIRPFVLNSDVPFNTDLRMLLTVGQAKENELCHYTIRRLIPEEMEGRPELFTDFVDIAGDTRVQTGFGINLDPESNRNAPLLQKVRLSAAGGSRTPSGDDYSGRNADRNNVQAGLLDFVISGDALEPGNYEVLIYREGYADTLKQSFKVVWENQPLSLRNLSYAIEISYYLMNEEEFDEMTSGSKAAQRRKFLEFWQKRDPTPGTAYNEAMAEYFARVDYAYFNYQTLEEQDGARTDRGKIFILHGKPTSTARNMEPDEPLQEIWTYSNNVAKKFIFVSESSGKFILKDIKEL